MGSVCFNRGETYSLVAALCSTGIIASHAINVAFDFESFWDFIFTRLVPTMNAFPFPGERSVIVLDNCRIHHNPEMIERLTDVYGVIFAFLPAYSPMYNQIEEVFGELKLYLKRIGPSLALLPDGFLDPKLLLTESIEEIIGEDKALLMIPAFRRT